jgi:hypothetical protein
MGMTHHKRFRKALGVACDSSTNLCWALFIFENYKVDGLLEGNVELQTNVQEMESVSVVIA